MEIITERQSGKGLWLFLLMSMTLWLRLWQKYQPPVVILQRAGLSGQEMQGVQVLEAGEEATLV